MSAVEDMTIGEVFGDRGYMTPEQLAVAVTWSRGQERAQGRAHE